MDIATAEQQHAAWLRPDTNRMSTGYDAPVGFPSEDISEMFLQNGFDGNTSHMNRVAANYYSQHSARAMAGYGSTHSKFSRANSLTMYNGPLLKIKT